MSAKLRILVADRQRSTRSALGMLLAAQPDLEPAGSAADIVELLSQIKANEPDLVVLDWDVLGRRSRRFAEKTRANQNFFDFSRDLMSRMPLGCSLLTEDIFNSPW